MALEKVNTYTQVGSSSCEDEAKVEPWPFNAIAIKHRLSELSSKFGENRIGPRFGGRSTVKGWLGGSSTQPARRFSTPEHILLMQTKCQCGAELFLSLRRFHSGIPQSSYRGFVFCALKEESWRKRKTATRLFVEEGQQIHTLKFEFVPKKLVTGEIRVKKWKASKWWGLKRPKQNSKPLYVEYRTPCFHSTT